MAAATMPGTSTPISTSSICVADPFHRPASVRVRSSKLCNALLDVCSALPQTLKSAAMVAPQVRRCDRAHGLPVREPIGTDSRNGGVEVQGRLQERSTCRHPCPQSEPCRRRSVSSAAMSASSALSARTLSKFLWPSRSPQRPLATAFQTGVIPLLAMLRSVQHLLELECSIAQIRGVSSGRPRRRRCAGPISRACDFGSAMPGCAPASAGRAATFGFAFAGDAGVQSSARTLRLASQDMGHTAFSALAQSRCKLGHIELLDLFAVRHGQLLCRLRDLIEQAPDPVLSSCRCLLPKARPDLDVSARRVSIKSMPRRQAATTDGGQPRQSCDADVPVLRRAGSSRPAVRSAECCVRRPRSTNRQSRPAAVGKALASTPTAPRARRVNGTVRQADGASKSVVAQPAAPEPPAAHRVLHPPSSAASWATNRYAPQRPADCLSRRAVAHRGGVDVQAVHDVDHRVHGGAVMRIGAAPAQAEFGNVFRHRPPVRWPRRCVMPLACRKCSRST